MWKEYTFYPQETQTRNFFITDAEAKTANARLSWQSCSCLSRALALARSCASLAVGLLISFKATSTSASADPFFLTNSSACFSSSSYSPINEWEIGEHKIKNFTVSGENVHRSKSKQMINLDKFLLHFKVVQLSPPFCKRIFRRQWRNTHSIHNLIWKRGQSSLNCFLWPHPSGHSEGSANSISRCIKILQLCKDV